MDFFVPRIVVEIVKTGVFDPPKGAGSDQSRTREETVEVTHWGDAVRSAGGSGRFTGAGDLRTSCLQRVSDHSVSVGAWVLG